MKRAPNTQSSGKSRAHSLLIAFVTTGLGLGLIQYFQSEVFHNAMMESRVWFFSGAALGACFLFGRKMAGAVFLGALLPVAFHLERIQHGNELAFWAFFAFCISLQSVTIYLGFRQSAVDKDPLRNSNSFLLFLLISGLIACITALLINMNYRVFIAQDGFQLDALFQSCLANMIGISTLTPLLCAWRPEHRKRRADVHAVEQFAWSALMLISGYASWFYQQNILIMMVPLLMWAAARFSQFGCAAAVVAATLLSLPELQTGAPLPSIGTTALLSPTHLNQFIWLVVIVITLYFNALLADRVRIEAKLEEIVQQRTQDLNLTNQELQDEVFVRQQAEKSFRNSSKRYRALIETAGIPIIVLDHTFMIRQWNGAAETLFGATRENALSTNFIDNFIPQGIQDELAWKFTKVIETGTTQENLESEVKNQEGEILIMLWNMNHLADNDDDRGRGQLLLIGQNISEIRKTQNQLHYLAHFDALTGTANRRLFEDRCQQAIRSALRHQHDVALIGLDIDHFKRINDTLGHDAGDEFLVTLAERLKNCVRKEDTIARLGGDEFAVLLANVSGQEGAEIVARNILEKITQPIFIGGSELIITSSIGITLCPTDGTHYPDLLKNADMAMYRAKNAGRNNIQFYSPEMNQEMQRQLRIEQELRSALQQDQLVLFYQPIIDIETGELVALEALLRWQHPDKGMLLPDYFLQVAEQTGQLHEIGSWALSKVCEEGKAIQDTYQRPVQIALNLSNRQYNHPGLVKMVESVTRKHGFSPRNLILEMSESTITANMESSFTTLHRLSQLGVSLTIDSFGTGLSSLRQLKQIPIDIIKIDRTFVNGIPEDENDMAITETLLAIAGQMDLRTFATGVETKEQEAFLKIHGCRYAQGYLYSPPLPSNQLARLIGNINEGHVITEGEQIFLPFQVKKSP